MKFKKLPRSCSTSNGCRLATYEEARNGLETIKALLEKWERARLLDGWISGPGYDFQMGNDFRGCMASMLVIELEDQASIASGTLYRHITTLSKNQKEVALLLCTEDWNYEVVYWVLNSLSGSETMDPADAAHENIPVNDSAKFKEMNTMMQDVVKRLVNEGPASEKLAKRKFSGQDSVKEVLSGMIEFVKEQQATMEDFSFNDTFGFQSFRDFTLEELSDMSLESVGLGDDVFQGDLRGEAIAKTYWNFLSESFASLMVLYFVCAIIVELCRFPNEWDRKKFTREAQENFLFASHVLFYISLARCQIIHEPLPVYSKGFCPSKILCWSSDKAEQQPERLNKLLQENALWKCYEETGNYEVLDKLLILASKGQALLQKGKKVDIHVIKRLLECGAKPGRSLRSCKSKTALHYAAKVQDEMVVKCLLENCDGNQKENFVNATDDKGRTALHRATELGNIPVCNLLLDYGAGLDAQDKCGQTVLHNAVDHGKEDLIDLFIEHPSITACLQLKNDLDDTPLDLALAQKNMKVVAQLLCLLDKPEDYFSKVHQGNLLCQSLLKGYVEIVKLILDKGKELPCEDIDHHGKTTLHLATMCENEKKAKEMVCMILREDQGKSLTKCDGSGRTVLHEAALKGHASLCKDLLDLDQNLIDVKDKYGRNALYDAVQGKLDNINSWKAMYGAYKKKGGKLYDLIDSRGMTPLHVAAEQGRKRIVEDLLSITQVAIKDIKRADFLGQTALHKAAKSGDKDTVGILLQKGANPFHERDCDGRTALHYVVQAKILEGKKDLAVSLLDSCKSAEEKLLFLWASAAGVGPADQNLTDPELKEFLKSEKERLKEETNSHNLLRTAASIGHTGMTKELLSRGCQMADIKNKEWLNSLNPKQKENVKKVTTQLERIAEQGNDLPSLQDNLERLDYAHGLAALLLNPFLKPPIVVGISGDWGKGKSSLMIQTESILLKTAAQLALLPSSHLLRSTSDLPGVNVLRLTKEGEKISHEIRRQLDMLELEGFSATANTKDADYLVQFLSNYNPKYRDIFKSLAVMDSTKMLTTKDQHLAVERSVPAIITVQYNAWKYRNETEALAGLAVEITTEIEGSMTDPQWLTTCFKNAWRNHKHSIWIEIIFPCLLAILLAGSFIWIVWLVFEKYKMEEWAKAKYACLPAAIVAVVWIVAKSVMGVLKPVSTQLMNYISFPDHADKLGYQDRVISDINFLKDEIGKKPSKICTAMVILWHFVITLKLWLAALSSFPKCPGNAVTNMKFPPAPSTNLQIIVFVDDLDRCQESVILQVLAAINLVLAVCEINVILGMDKGLIERAIMKKYGNSKARSSNCKELADNYLQKIIQLPLDLPDPSEQQLSRFLKRQMGVVEKEINANDTDLEKDAQNAKIKKGQMSKLLSLKSAAPDAKKSTEPNTSGNITHGMDGEDQSIAIVVDNSREQRETRNEISNPLVPIPITEMLFVTYSSGEWDAVCHFKKFATDCRKLPREWKRFLNYHRLVWNILSINIVDKSLDGWQVQLISWIFICWEWKENMDILLQDWCNVGVLRTLKSKNPSLGIIVEHFIEECGSNNRNGVQESENRKGKPEEKDGVANGEQSNKDNNMTETSNQEDTAQTAEDSQEEENRLKKPEVEMKEEMRAMKEQLLSMEKSLEELKKTISELKLGQGTKQGTPKNENSMDGRKIKQKDMPNWWRLRLALDKYDVTMDGIEAFQRFRFYCVPGHLQWPLPEQEFASKPVRQHFT